MIVELNENEHHFLFVSSLSCEFCDALYKKYNKKRQFDTNDLTRKELIHIETTTRKNIGDLKFIPAMF